MKHRRRERMTMNKRHMNFQVLGRLLRYVLKHYKFSC